MALALHLALDGVQRCAPALVLQPQVLLQLTGGLGEILPHCFCIFPVHIALGLYFTGLKAESVGIEVQGGLVSVPDVQGDGFGIEGLRHGSEAWPVSF